MNLANKLTMGRIVMAFFFMGAMLWQSLPYNYAIATGLFTLAWVTDILDGMVARSYGLVTNFGKLIDPLSDKILMTVGYVLFVQIPEIKMQIPAWMVIVIISREFIVTGIRLLAATRGTVISAGLWGKHKTTAQMTTLSLFLMVMSLQQIAPGVWTPGVESVFQVVKYIVLYITVALTALSGFLYLKKHQDL